MKKIFIVSVLTATLVGLGVLAGCSLIFGEDKVTVEVYTVEDLQKSGDNFVLMNDIDIGNQTITPISVNEFDGNGYTISNAIINYSGERAGFFYRAQEIKNVTFENITLTANSAEYAGIVFGGTASTVVGASDSQIENVHVKDSTLIVVQGEDDLFVGGLVGNHSGTISSCSVENLEISVTGIEGTWSLYDIYLGGLAGSCSIISGSNAVGCTLSAEAKNIYNTPIVGGLVGKVGERLENSYSKNNTIEAKDTWYSENIAGKSGASVTAGGLYGESNRNTVIRYCYSDNNDIDVTSTGTYYVGGFGGYNCSGVEQSYSVNNSLRAVGTLDNIENDDWVRRAGAMCGVSISTIDGRSTGASFTSSFTFGNSVECIYRSNGTETIDNYGIASGFVATTGTHPYSYCISGLNVITAGSSDEFSCSTFTNNMANSCMVTSGVYNNRNGFEIFPETSWYSESTIKDALNLVGGNWVFSNNAIPALS